MKMESLKNELAQFTGTENYHRHTGRILYTDGVKYLAEKAGCYWLLDLIASYQPDLENQPFQVWTIKVDFAKQSAVVTMQEDSGGHELVRQEIEYTDFPLKRIKLYCIDKVLMLLSEY